MNLIRTLGEFVMMLSYKTTEKFVDDRFEGIVLSRLQPWSRKAREVMSIINDGADGFTGKQLAKSHEGLAALDGRREGGRVLGWAGPQHHLQG